MDYIKELDIRLDKEYYYAGEILVGRVILDTSENFKLKSIRLVLRGKAHAEWKVFVSGDKRTVKDDQYYIDERAVIWGQKSNDGDHEAVPILQRGHHEFPFRFGIPETNLPCSFESRACQIRYYIKVTLDIPYASPPQGIKYFTIIGPHIDCMEEQYLKPLSGQDKKVKCCLCCAKGPVTLSCSLDRSAYCCGETLKLKAVIDNQGEDTTRLKVRLLQVCLEFDKTGDDLQIIFPITIATVPFRIPNSNLQPILGYDLACDHVEGGIYIGPEFLLGEVYDGFTSNENEPREISPLYRPVYITVIKSSQQMASNSADKRFNKN
ncbi:arrestin domain-containing protein 3-like isoform X2 [Phlebotomus papatasi]|uniref:arrestin domain-containing protein 3-like isoform X2 n=1 Tax=Phlebotomus papatasi TaxID=29031 RepID=UPI0024837AF2|nr:arrestin domain-containing protein 3-like isoform X2 [Phlebotomus papatasi]